MNISRRDFLKALALCSLFPVARNAQRVLRTTPIAVENKNSPNVIILLFDALSAAHMSIYGYRRETTPHMARFAAQSNVYHAHYAAGSFTTPSTASLISGTYPWTHRALQHSGLILREFSQRNLFHLVGNRYHKLTYAQNVLADILLHQFPEDIDRHIRPDEFSLMSALLYCDIVNPKSLDFFRSYDDLINQLPGSLFLPVLEKFGVLTRLNTDLKQFETLYPRGIPNLIRYDTYFLLEPVFGGVIELLAAMPAPGLAYIHLYPPHEYYFPRKEFVGIFDDGWTPRSKPSHAFSEGWSEAKLAELRQSYDEYIAHTDAEFGRVINALSAAGMLENSYIFVTSDHGQLFERGVHGHLSPLMYEGGIRIPLLVSSPEQSKRKDIHTLTSTVDIMPTILNITGESIPEWCEGSLLPGFGGEPHPERSVFTIDAKPNVAYDVLETGTIAMMKGDYKLIAYLGYDGLPETYELYDLKRDPEEMNDLFPTQFAIARNMKEELATRLVAANQPFTR